jgi:hypothetical protein
MSNILPIFRNFDPKKRKRNYTLSEVIRITAMIGEPPNTKNYRQLKAKYKKYCKLQKEII